MPRKNPPNFPVLGAHLLTIADAHESRGELAGQPSNRVLAVAAVIELCFGPDSAEAIALDLIASLDEFDDVQREEFGHSSPYARQDYIVTLLESEFGEEFPDLV